MQVLYVFVEIQFDTSHLVQVLMKHFSTESKISLMGTIQFTNALHHAQQELVTKFPNIRIPQGKPLSPGTNTFDPIDSMHLSFMYAVYLYTKERHWGALLQSSRSVTHWSL